MPHKATTPVGRGDSQLLEDPHHARADARLIARAIREGWIIPKSYKKELPRRMMEIARRDTVQVLDSQGRMVDVDNSRTAIAAGMALVRMEEQNQRDELTAIEHQRLDEGKPTANIVTSNPTLDNLVQRLLSQRVPEHLWPPLVREHRKLIESKQL